MQYKLLFENWRKHLKEYDYSDKGGLNVNVVASQRTTSGAIKASEEHLKYAGEVGKAAFELWNRTAGEVFFKVPGLPGAEGYTLTDLGIDLTGTILGAAVMTKLAKGASKLYKMNQTRKKTGSWNISEDDYKKLFFNQAILLRQKPTAQQKFVAAVAAVAGFGAEQIAVDELKSQAKHIQNEFEKTKTKIETGELASSP